jgi:excisionase family DNA binding protein
MARDPLLSVRDVAERLGVSLETVRKFARTNELQHVAMMGRGYRFTEAQVEAFVRTKTSRGRLPLADGYLNVRMPRQTLAVLAMALELVPEGERDRRYTNATHIIRRALSG